MTQTLILWLLYGFPEVILMLYCGTRMLGLQPPARRFLPVALGLSIFAGIARSFPIPFGSHVALVFLAYCVVTALAFGLSGRTAVLSTAVGFVLLTVGETVVVAPLLTSTRLAFGAALQTSLPVKLAFSYLSSSALILASIAILLFRIRLFTVPESTRDIRQQREA